MTGSTEKTKDLVRYADVAMYEAVPTGGQDREPVEPKVSLLFITLIPLGAVAASSEMYRGRPVRSYREVGEDQRSFFWEDIKRTRLNSPYEFVDLHFLFEGVTRAFTHQLVRQRVGAVYVQESQRFAVKTNGAHEVGVPPSIAGRKDDDPMVVEWERATAEVGASYLRLIEAGMPAEDARGLLPTNITTRIHYKVNLRSLQDHAGNRLCTQAQFEWRKVWLGIVAAIRATQVGPETGDIPADADGDRYVWRANEVADLFRPICYQTGKCGFKSDLDRHCSIRERVSGFEAANVPSAEWDAGRVDLGLPGIRPAEWLLDHASGRLSPEAAQASGYSRPASGTQEG